MGRHVTHVEAPKGLPMAIRLPTFKDTACRYLIVCSELRTDDEDLRKWLKEQETMIAHYTNQGETVLVQAYFGGTSDRHMHIDVATSEYFGGQGLPAPTHQWDEVQAAIDKFMGLEAKAGFDGYYWITADRLPPLITSTIIETLADGVGIKTVGGRLAVHGAPISRLDWTLLEGKGEARIRLEADKEVKIQESYLVDALDLLTAAFRVFVLGKESHGPSPRKPREKQD